MADERRDEGAPPDHEATPTRAGDRGSGQERKLPLPDEHHDVAEEGDHEAGPVLHEATPEQLLAGGDDREHRG